MGQATLCPNCGVALPANAPAGQCPACLLRIGMAVADGGLGFTLGDAPEPAAPARLKSPRDKARGRVVGGYELIEEIAHGGMGVVYKARQTSLDRLVALKMVRMGEFANESELARFHAEAEAAAHLNHPNIVPIYEVGEYEGRHYFSMELIEGGPLSQRISHPDARLSAREAARILATVARAVHYAHQRGILHRDLKPGNILLDARGEPHVTDFGLAKRIETDSAMTLTGGIVGTPAYIAPEQAAGAKEVTTAADVYSLGAILYELLAGQLPFVGATVIATLQKVLNEEPPPLIRDRRRQESRGGSETRSGTSTAAGLDRDLETICLKCLEKDPVRRYGSAEAVADDLERWLRHEPIAARPAHVFKRFTKWMRRNPLLAGSLAAVSLVAVIGFTGIVWQWRAAVAARRATQEELWRSQLLEARSFRLKVEPGRRAAAWETIARAAAYRPSVELRNEALAALVLPDLGSNLWWRNEPRARVPHAFSGDLNFFARNAANGEIAIFCQAGPRPVARFRGLGGSATAMRFSPDDSLLAAKFSNGLIGVWRWREGQVLLQAHSWRDDFEIPSFDFTPDGRELWISDAQEQLARFSLPQGQALPAPTLDRPVQHLQFDRSGRRLAAWSSNSVMACEASTGEVLNEWQSPGDIWCLDWHPRGDAFACGTYGQGVHLAEIGQTNLAQFSTDASVNAVFTSIGFGADGNYLAAGGWGNLFTVWNYGTRQQELRSRSHGFQQFSRDGTQMALRAENVGYGVRTFESPIGVRRLRVPTVLGGEASAGWHPGGRWLLTGHPFGWCLWDSTTGRPVNRYEGSTMIRTIDFLPDGSAFLTGGGAGAQLWAFSIEDGAPRVGPPATLTSTRFVPHERAALSPDGERFAAVGEFAWLGWTDGKRTPVSIAEGDGNDSVSFSPDGRWLLLRRFRGTHLKIRDAFTGRVVTNLATGTSNGRFTPRGDQLISVSATRITYWEVGTWKKLREVEYGNGSTPISPVDFWPDGSCLLVNGLDGAVRLWDPEGRKEIAALWLPVDSILWGASFAPLGQRMAATFARPCVDLWDFSVLRRELVRFGLDWPGESPSTDFAPRR